MRPLLRTGVPLLWRSDTLLQFGTDPDRALATEVTSAEHLWLNSLDGSLTLEAALSAADRAGIPAATATGLLELLAQAGGLEDAGLDVPELRGASAGERDRLAPDIAASGLAHREPGSGVAAMSARRGARVEVRGNGRVAVATAALLGSGGIGTLLLDDAIRDDGSPFSAGLPAGAGLRGVVERAAPSTRVLPQWSGGDSPMRPSVVVLADQILVEPDETTELVAADVPHLQVHATGHHAVVGPLVVPGRTACLRCIHLTRRDRDPSWPRQAAQLGALTRSGPVDMVLATLAAALTVRRVCGLLEWTDSGDAFRQARDAPSSSTC